MDISILNTIIIERVLERGERIELLVDKTDNLNQQAFAFKKRSTQLKVTINLKQTRTIKEKGNEIITIHLRADAEQEVSHKVDKHTDGRTDGWMDGVALTTHFCRQTVDQDHEY